MKRPIQHVMEDESERLLHELLPAAWIVRRLPKDYGVDFEIELVDQETVSGNRIWIQLKAVREASAGRETFLLGDQFGEFFPERDERGRVKLDVSYVSFPIDTKTVLYSLRCAFPLLLFVADLTKRDIHWLPMRDDIFGTLSQRNPDWATQQSVTLRIPSWNLLSGERHHNYPGLRWYALEPARMYAFVTLHYYHHEFQYRGRLSGYSIGDGWIDDDEEGILRSSLALAARYISAALQLDVLFGEQGLDFFTRDYLPGIGVAGAKAQLEDALKAAAAATEMLDKKEYSFVALSFLIGSVNHAIELFSTCITSYQGFRDKHLLTESAVVWHLSKDVHGEGSAPFYPTRTQHTKGT